MMSTKELESSLDSLLTSRFRSPENLSYYVEDKELTDARMLQLANAIESGKFSRGAGLTFCGRCASREQIQWLANALSSQGCPENFYLVLPSRLDDDMAQPLVEALAKSKLPRGLILDFSQTDITDATAIKIAQAFNNGNAPRDLSLLFNHASVSWNTEGMPNSMGELGKQTAEWFADAISGGVAPRGLTLSLENQRLDSREYRMLIEALCAPQAPQDIEIRVADANPQAREDYQAITACLIDCLSHHQFPANTRISVPFELHHHLADLVRSRNANNGFYLNPRGGVSHLEARDFLGAQLTKYAQALKGKYRQQGYFVFPLFKVPTQTRTIRSLHLFFDTGAPLTRDALMLIATSRDERKSVFRRSGIKSYVNVLNGTENVIDNKLSATDRVFLSIKAFLDLQSQVVPQAEHDLQVADADQNDPLFN